MRGESGSAWGEWGCVGAWGWWGAWECVGRAGRVTQEEGGYSSSQAGISFTKSLSESISGPDGSMSGVPAATVMMVSMSLAGQARDMPHWSQIYGNGKPGGRGRAASVERGGQIAHSEAVLIGLCGRAR